MHAEAAPAATPGQASDAGIVAPQDVGVNHDSVIMRICWLLRVAIFCGLCGSMLHLALYLLGYAADVGIALVKFTGAISICAVSAHSMYKSEPHVHELQKLYGSLCVSQVVFAFCVMAATVEWKTHDIVVMVVTRPLLSLLAMCVHTVLEVVGHAQPYALLVGTCTAINAAVVCKVRSDMPTLVGVSCSGIIIQIFVALLLKSTTNILLKERDVLKLVREGLQQQLDSQDSMWKSVFDATFLCDSSGRVVRASPQAVDLFQLGSAAECVGSSLHSLAKPEEVKRLTTFVQSVAESPNQAMTIQATFEKRNSSSRNESMELQVNAVRVVQSVCDPSTNMGVLVGVRVIETPKECMPRPETLESEGEHNPGSSDDTDDLWISFDAATKNFHILDHSPELDPTGGRDGLVSWFPPMARAGMEKWIVDEVGSCGDQGGMSSHVIEGCQLRMPAIPATFVSARRAWLEVKQTEVDEDGDVSLPAILWLRGGTARERGGCSSRARSSGIAGASKLDVITEHDLVGASLEAEGGGVGECADLESLASEEMAPSDSASMSGMKFRARAREDCED